MLFTSTLTKCYKNKILSFSISEDTGMWKSKKKISHNVSHSMFSWYRHVSQVFGINLELFSVFMTKVLHLVGPYKVADTGNIQSMKMTISYSLTSNVTKMSKEIFHISNSHSQETNYGNLSNS